MATFVDDTVAVLDELGRRPGALYGQSFGGMVAQELALARPDRVRTARARGDALRGTHVVPVPREPRAEGRAVAGPVRARVPRRPPRARGRGPPHRRASSRDTRAAVADNGRRCSPWTAFDRLPEIAAPTLVLHGAEDRLIAPRTPRCSLDRIPGAELVLLEGAGHLYHSEQAGGRRRRRARLRAAASPMRRSPARSPALAERRAAARAARDFASADALRDELAAAGWTVARRAGRRVAARARRAAGCTERAEPVRAGRRAVECSTSPRPTTSRVHWVVRGMARRHRARDGVVPGARGRTAACSYVVADVTGTDPAPSSPGHDDVEVISLARGHGLGARRATRASAGAPVAIVLVMDGSVEADGDVFGPLERALDDRAVGIAGPFGIVTHDLRQFEEAPGPGRATRSRATAWRCGARRARRRRRVRREVPVVPHGRHRAVVPGEGPRAAHARSCRCPSSEHEHRMWFETDSRRAGEVVEAELLPVPRPVARPVGPGARPASATVRDGTPDAPECPGQSIGGHRRRGRHRDLRRRAGSGVALLRDGRGGGRRSRSLASSCSPELLGVRDRLRAGRVRLEVVAVDRLGHEQQRREPVEHVAVLAAGCARPGRAPRSAGA